MMFRPALMPPLIGLHCEHEVVRSIVLAQGVGAARRGACLRISLFTGTKIEHTVFPASRVDNPGSQVSPDRRGSIACGETLGSTVGSVWTGNSDLTRRFPSDLLKTA